MMQYRRAQPADARLLAALRQKVWASTYRGIYPDEMIDGFDYDWHIVRETRNLQNPDYHTYFILDSTQCIGYVTCIVKQKPLWREYHVRLLSLYLLPAFQGKGIGRSTFRFVATSVLTLGYGKLWLSCHPQNTSALGFYQHMGGIVVKEDLGREDPVEDSIELEFDCHTILEKDEKK